MRTERRVCKECSVSDVHPQLRYTCAACHMEWCCGWMTTDESIVTHAEGLDLPTVDVFVGEDEPSHQAQEGAR